jgi:hypothetical protein
LLREPAGCGPSPEPLTHGTLRRSARRPSRPWAQGRKRRRDPTIRARQRATPVVQLGAVDTDQRAHPRPLRYLIVPQAGAFSQWEAKLRLPAPPLPNALTASHASDTDDEIQLTTRPRSHHSALRGEATIAQCAGRPIDPASRAHELDGDQIPNASQNRPEPEIAGPQASARSGNGSVRGGLLRLTAGERPGVGRGADRAVWARAGPVRGSERGHADPDHHW